MSWELIITQFAGIFTALGGLELFKWFKNRKAYSRIADTEADSAQFHTLQETILFLQTQLKEKEERFAEQTQLVRKLNTEVIDLMRDKAASDLELATKRCDDMPCPFRMPPNAHTPPQIGLTKEIYHQQKRSNNEKDNSD